MKPRICFKINNQTIKRVDDFKVVSSSKNYLYAEFDFVTDDWNGVNTKTALFRSNKIVKQVLLDANDCCLVPWEVLENDGFMEVSVFGGNLITVNIAKVRVYESGYSSDGSEPEPPSPDIYTQIIEDVDNVKQDVVAIDARTQVATDDEVDEMIDDVFNGTVTDEELFDDSGNSTTDD